jgi:Holliday junction resolvasome RuvABC endonuclease subunit
MMAMNNKPRVLALDLAQHFGWACNNRDDYKLISSGHVKLKMKNRELVFQDWVLQHLRMYTPDYVVYENIQFSRNVQAGHCAGMWRGLLNAACQSCIVKAIGVPVGTWKLHLCGKGHGKCKKPEKGDTFEYQPIIALRERGYAVTDDNEADAIGILLYALECDVVEVGE